MELDLVGSNEIWFVQCPSTSQGLVRNCSNLLLALRLLPFFISTKLHQFLSSTFQFFRPIINFIFIHFISLRFIFFLIRTCFVSETTLICYLNFVSSSSEESNLKTNNAILYKWKNWCYYHQKDVYRMNVLIMINLHGINARQIN